MASEKLTEVELLDITPAEESEKGGPEKGEGHKTKGKASIPAPSQPQKGETVTKVVEKSSNIH